MRRHEEWKVDERFHALLLKLNDEASADPEVKRLQIAEHNANQLFLMQSEYYTRGLNRKMRELYQAHGIDPVCLEPSEKENAARIERRERYIANGCKGEY